MKDDNQLTRDREVIVAALVAGLNIYFAYMILEEIHESAFKPTLLTPIRVWSFRCAGTIVCRYGPVIN